MFWMNLNNINSDTLYRWTR